MFKIAIVLRKLKTSTILVWHVLMILFWNNLWFKLKLCNWLYNKGVFYKHTTIYYDCKTISNKKKTLFIQKLAKTNQIEFILEN